MGTFSLKSLKSLYQDIATKTFRKDLHIIFEVPKAIWRKRPEYFCYIGADGEGFSSYSF